jgi:hypothetical protein
MILLAAGTTPEGKCVHPASARRSPHHTPRPLLVAIALIGAFLTACDDGVTAPPNGAGTVASLVIVPDSVVLPRGASMRLEAALYDAAGNIIEGRAITWRSSDDARVQVNASGMIAALAGGVAVVRASSEGKEDSVRVRVTD